MALTAICPRNWPHLQAVLLPLDVRWRMSFDESSGALRPDAERIA
jgi:hypothetical protein